MITLAYIILIILGVVGFGLVGLAVCIVLDCLLAGIIE